MKLKNIKYLIFTLAALIFLCLSKQVNLKAATYPTSSTIISTNLLSGQSEGLVVSFIYNLSSKPAGSSAEISFSQDGMVEGGNWYNSSGTLNGTDTLTTGANNTIDLSGLGWTGANFYYKIVFGGDGEVTPVLDDITVKYSAQETPALSNLQDATISTDSYFFGVPDGDEAGRVIDGVDKGTEATNSGTITIDSDATLTLLSNETLVAGSFIINSGSIAIPTGARLLPGGVIYAVDADNDGTPATTSAYKRKQGDSAGNNFVRRNAMSTIAAADCNDGDEYIGTHLATGGTINNINGEVIHTFTSSDSFNVTCGGEISNAQILVVGGGGGGGKCTDVSYIAGGGGAGGLIYKTGVSLPVCSGQISPNYSIGVGAGGASSTVGENSYISCADFGDGGSFFEVAWGGGDGGNGNAGVGGYGGSGGGAGRGNTTVYFNGSEQGNRGGTGYSGTGSSSCGGGGGGAGAQGEDKALTNVNGGNGGDGLSYSISGTATYYAGGGGGADGNAGTSGSGGLGGGGAGAPTSSSNGVNGTANTGGGGGGSACNSTTARTGGVGGSGIVIIRYSSF